MMKMIAVLACMAFATALPSTADDIVREGLDTSSMAPPTEFVEVSAFDEAQATVNSMIKSGKDEGACADLAAATIKEVEDAVDSQQKVLDSLDTGADCPNKGQGEVDSAESTLDGATKDKEAADAAAAAAAAADINFASRPLSQLTPGQCGVFFSDPAYTSAVAAKEAAAGSASQAAAAVTAAEAGLESAKQAQQDAIKECQCSAKKAYAAAWEAANSNNDANEKAYTKGKHMACVLAGTPPASCNVGAIPTVTAVTLTAAVESATCNDKDYEEMEPKIFQSGDNSPVPEEGVTFYKHCVSDGRYTAGYRVTIFHDTPNVGAVGMRNNDVSSIWIPGGWKVEIYDNQNYGGIVKKFDACNKDNFHVPCLVNQGFNDRMESVKMSPCQ